MSAREWYVRKVRRGEWKLVTREGGPWATWTESIPTYACKADAMLAGKLWGADAPCAEATCE